MEAKGDCRTQTSGIERFPASQRNKVLLVKATINGREGRFVFDTGASLVSIKKSFALAAGDATDGELLKLHTSSGTADGRMTTAKMVSLGRLEARDVSVVVQDDAGGMYGQNVDGLLGMSFLGRFTVEMDSRYVTVRAVGQEPAPTSSLTSAKPETRELGCEQLLLINAVTARAQVQCSLKNHSQKMLDDALVCKKKLVSSKVEEITQKGFLAFDAKEWELGSRQKACDYALGLFPTVLAR